MTTIGELGVGQSGTIQVAIVAVDLLLTRDMKKWCNVTLRDCTGEIKMPVWSEAEEFSHNYPVGSYAEVTGKVGQYNGTPQLSMTSIGTLSNPSEELKGVLLPSYPISDELKRYFFTMVGNLSSPYKELASYILNCDGIRSDMFFRAPVSGGKQHHGKVHGLFHHSLGVARLVATMYSHLIGGSLSHVNTHVQQDINRDRLIFLALVHDIGKIYEYVWDVSIGFNKENLVDHRYAFVSMFDEAVLHNPTLQISNKECQEIKHAVLAHHGVFGDVPLKTAEEYTLHYCDMLDAHMDAFAEGLVK